MSLLIGLVMIKTIIIRRRVRDGEEYNRKSDSEKERGKEKRKEEPGGGEGTKQNGVERVWERKKYGQYNNAVTSLAYKMTFSGHFQPKCLTVASSNLRHALRFAVISAHVQLAIASDALKCLLLF